MVCPHCGADNAENARFCVSCGQPLPRACPNCGAVNPPGARFCNQCGFALDTPSAPGPLLGASGADLRSLADAATEDDSSAPHPLEETEQRRIVTVLFADLANSTALAESLDAEEMRAILADFFSAMSREIHRHGGSVEKYIGDAIMAVFGLPIAHEDDPMRAIRAALDMQASLRELNASLALADDTAGEGETRPELRLRIGINTGEVAAAAAAREGQDFLITGDPVNVAARLQQLAAPGTILIGPRTYRRARGIAEFRQVPAVPLRGKSRTVDIWEVIGLLDDAHAPSTRGAGSARTPLVGREVELALLDAVALRVMREQSPHLVTIVGAPGVGKTRLAREFTRRVGVRPAISVDERDAQDAGSMPLLLEGRCPPYGEDVTYFPLTEMLRCYAGFSGLEPPERARMKLLEATRRALSASHRAENAEVIAAYLGHTIGIESAERRHTLLPADATQLQDGSVRAWRVFFEALATPRGLVAMIDDAHWADDALLDLLASVATLASGVSLLFVLTARSDLMERRPTWGGGRRNYVTLGLEPLSPNDAARLLDELLPGSEVPDTLRQGILDKADGNPFYVEEIVRMLVDRGALTQEKAGGWRVAPEWENSEEVRDPVIPDTVQGVLAARLDLLSHSERDVLQHAAVIGRYFWPSALLYLAQHLRADDLSQSLRSLTEKDLIHPSERTGLTIAAPGETAYTFNHGLTREVVYSAIPRTRRAHEHLRIAEWLRTLAPDAPGQFIELLAQHYYRYYTLANLSRSRDQERRRQARTVVVSALQQAGEQSVARHALAKADTYFTNALELFGEEVGPDDAPLVVALHTARGAARWTALRADDAWIDYRDALRVWSATSASIAPANEPVQVGAHARGVATPVAAGSVSQPPSASQPGILRSPTMPAMLPLDWRQQGMRLYRVLAQLPTRNQGLFRRLPPHEELGAYLDEALRLADELGQRDTLDYAELLTAKSFFWWSWAERRSEGDLLDAYRSAREAVRITEALSDARAASEALDALGNIQAIMTDLTGYLESQKRRLRWIAQIDEAQEIVDINTEVSQAYQLVGEFAEAVRHAQTALTLAHEVDADTLRVKALWGLTLAQFEWDHWPEAIDTGAELQARAQHTIMRQSNHHLWVLLSLATIAARTGDADSAERMARIVAETTSEPAQEVEVARARLSMARGEPREAQQTLLNALEIRAGRQSMAALMAELAELAARSGDLDLYDRFGAGALELGWRSGARKPLAQAIRARAVVGVSAGHWDDALADAQNALTRYRELGCVWEEARSRYVLAGLFRRRAERGDDERAREELTQALRLFDELRAVRDIARVRAALAGGDVRLP
ncbi:MAG TPA: adenylate/guanylate cyclase domain-containing protein [Ktedonobacterales bacterium]|jgi:class 3 adenylate cyclase/tetratricopeptide (TPR) repeat protein/ribosomal protein L40E|nr:adenylate/guanylate cyclase domain-containing protein [Ktedonobacterales bacterium]